MSDEHPLVKLARATIETYVQERRTIDPPAELTPEPASHDPSPLARAIEAEQLEQVLDAAARLTKLRRDAFVLRFVHSATYEQVGQQLGRSPHQARALCHKAVDRLRKMLNEGRKGRRHGQR